VADVDLGVENRALRETTELFLLAWPYWCEHCGLRLLEHIVCLQRAASRRTTSLDPLRTVDTRPAHFCTLPSPPATLQNHKRMSGAALPKRWARVQVGKIMMFLNIKVKRRIDPALIL